MLGFAKPNMTSPIHRGVFVREQLLCTALPPPPPDAMVVAPDPDPSLTTREIFEIHTQDAACAGCHALIDPIGLGLSQARSDRSRRGSPRTPHPECESQKFLAWSGSGQGQAPQPSHPVGAVVTRCTIVALVRKRLGE